MVSTPEAPKKERWSYSWKHLYDEVVTSGLCTGCAGCVIACPHDVLGYDDENGVYKPQQIEDLLDAGLTEGRQAPDIRASNENRAGAERERFEHVGPATEAAIDKHRYLSANCVDYFRKALDGSTAGVAGASAVV